MRVFNQIRTAIIGTTDIRLEIAEIKNALARQSKRQDDQDKNVELVFQYLDIFFTFVNYMGVDRPVLGMLVIPATIGEFWMIGYLLIYGIQPLNG